MNTTYKLQHTSIWLNEITVFAISFIVFIITVIMVFNRTFEGDFYWLPPFFVFPIAVSGFLTANILGRYEVEISITEAGINFYRKKKFWLKEYSFFSPWNQIKSFAIKREGVFQIFKLYTRKGKKFRITHSRYSNDNFEIFCNHFLNKIND